MESDMKSIFNKEYISDPRRKENFDEEYNNFILSSMGIKKPEWQNKPAIPPGKKFKMIGKRGAKG